MCSQGLWLGFIDALACDHMQRLQKLHLKVELYQSPQRLLQIFQLGGGMTRNGARVFLQSIYEKGLSLHALS